MEPTAEGTGKNGLSQNLLFGYTRRLLQLAYAFLIRVLEGIHTNSGRVVRVRVAL